MDSATGLYYASNEGSQPFVRGDADQLNTGTIAPHLLPNQGFVLAPSNDTVTAVWDAAAADLVNQFFKLSRQMRRRGLSANLWG